MENKNWFETDDFGEYAMGEYTFLIDRSDRLGFYIAIVKYKGEVMFKHYFWGNSDRKNIKAMMLVSAREHFNKIKASLPFPT